MSRYVLTPGQQMLLFASSGRLIHRDSQMIMHLATPQSAVLSAVIFNALIIITLIPLALKGISYRPVGAGPLLRRHILIYGAGGIVVPFIGIKLIDMLLVALHLI